MNPKTQTQLVIFPPWLSVVSEPLHKTQDFTHSATSQKNGAGLFSPVHMNDTRSLRHLSKSSPLHSFYTKPSHKGLTIPYGILRHGGLPEVFQTMQLCPSCGSTWIMLSYTKRHLKIILCVNTVKASHPWITFSSNVLHPRTFGGYSMKHTT